MKCNINYFKNKNDLVAHDRIDNLNLILPADGKLEEKEGPIGWINSCGRHCSCGRQCMVMFVVIVVMITVVALTIIAIVVVILVHIVLMAIMFVVTAWCDRILYPGFGRILFRVRKSCHKVDFRRHAEQIRPSSWPARRASKCHDRIFISQGCETNPAEFLAGSTGATFQAGKLSQH